MTFSLFGSAGGVIKAWDLKRDRVPGGRKKKKPRHVRRGPRCWRAVPSHCAAAACAISPDHERDGRRPRTRILAGRWQSRLGRDGPSSTFITAGQGAGTPVCRQLHGRIHRRQRATDRHRGREPGETSGRRPTPGPIEMEAYRRASLHPHAIGASLRCARVTRNTACHTAERTIPISTWESSGPMSRQFDARRVRPCRHRLMTE